MNFRRKSFFITTFLFLALPLNVYANPQGQNVVSGSATFDSSTPNTFTVNTASNNTIIDYNSFNIAANETTRFNQPNANSAVLNRVLGIDPSEIYGTLSSNGKLFLVNPNGIIFGPNSTVNAPAIVVSTLDISNNDFLNGNYNFFKNKGSAFIINQGRLAATPGGYIALLSQAIDNQGAIIAPLGTVALAAGDKLTLSLDSQSQISVAVDDAVKAEVLGPDGQKIDSAIKNSGKIKANGGKVLLTTKVLNDVFDNAVNNTGVIQAGSIQKHDGIVELVASGAPQGIYSTGSLIAPTLNLISDGDISSLGTLESSSLLERGNTFQVGGIFHPGDANVKNADDAMTYSSNTNVSGTITDPGNIIVDPSVVLSMTADTTFEAGNAFTMDPTSVIGGYGYNLSISALNSSTLGNISDVNLLTLSLISGSTPVTFTSNSSSTFQVNTVKTDYLSSLSRSVGSGTSLDPIMIYSDSDASGGLQYIPTSGLGLYYKLANNIDASETSSWNSGAGFTPIGNNSIHFTGTFDGNNYTISNLFEYQPAGSYIGLFGYAYGATISNVGVTNVNMTGYDYVGGLVGFNYSSSSINNAYSTGSVTGYDAYTGGLVGGNNTSATITDSYSTVSVSGYDYVGGLVGYNTSSSITNSYATGAVTGSDVYIGGLVGENTGSGTVSNSYATGTVTGTNVNNDIVGGLVGYNNGATVSDSYATGAVSGIGSYVGGLVGINTAGSISNSYATGAAYGTGGLIGGLVGGNSGSSTVSNSFATGAVTGSGGDLGGLIGYDSNTNTLTNNWWYDSLTYGIGSNGSATSTGNWEKASSASDFYGTGSGVGSLYSTWTFGSGGWDSFASTYPHLYWEWSPTITTLLQLQNINLDLSGNYTLGNNIDATGTEWWNSGAGFTPIGNNSTPFTGTFDGNNYTIANLFAYQPSGNYIGLFGYTLGSTISNVGVTNVNMTGYDYVGGLVGFNYSSSSINNAYSTGVVTGYDAYAGGLVGENNTSSTITDSYSGATVVGNTYVGGLLGYNYSSSVADSYATGTVTGSGYHTGGLVGENYDSTVSDSYATGAVSGFDVVGGLVGWNFTYSGISNSYATGAVTGDNTVGGLVGWNYFNSTISNSYAIGSATATSGSAGGLVGSDNSSSSITNSYATGAVSGSGGTLGGLIGYDDNTNTLTNNWWYNSLTYGIGSNGSATSTGNWEKASSASDFYGTGSGVGSLYSTWTFGSGGWDSFASTYPHLYWEWSPTITTLLQLQNINLDLSGNYTLGNNIDATGTEWWNSGAGFIPIGNNSTPFTGTFDGNNYTIANLFAYQPSGNNIGLFGYISGASVSNIGVTNVNMTGYDYVGGLVGFNYSSSSINNAYSTGVVTGYDAYAGGLVGENNTSSTITDSYSGATVVGNTYVGGLLGYNYSSSVADSYATGTVTGSGYHTGGLVGENYDSTVSDSYATGAVSGFDVVGGLVGWNFTYSGISNSYATGAVTGDNTVGGLVGWNYFNSTISNSYAIGSATATSGSAGGLVGSDNSSSSITNSYATGAVSGSGGTLGGLIGYDDNTNTLTNNWWYNSLTYGIGNNGIATSAGNWDKASGASDFYSSSFSVYTGSSPWDFTSVWFPPSSAYPLLR